MARRQARREHIATKRHQQKAARKRRKERGESYPRRLVSAIREFMPYQFFSRLTVLFSIKWTPQHLYWSGVLMAWSAEQTLDERFQASRDLLKEMFPKWSLGKTYTGFCQAQIRFLPHLKPALTKRMQKQIQEIAGKHWTRQGWCAFAADGSRVECPRTGANKKKLGCAGKKKTGPQLFLTTLWHMGTGLPWDFRIGPGTDSERRHLEDMLGGLPANSLLVADAGFMGYDFYRRIMNSGQMFLMRVGANVHLLRKLGLVNEKRHTVYVWPSERLDQPPLKLRLIVRQEGKQRIYLVTNVLERALLSEKTAGFLYEMRWGVEVFYRSTKQTMQKRKMLSRSPEAAKCELAWAIFGIWLLGLMSVSAIIAKGRDPLKWSAAAARRKVRRHLRLVHATDRRCPRPLSDELSTALQDTYERTGSKKAHDWPHKKTEKPPGAPKIRLPNKKQLRALKRLMKDVPAA